MLGIAKDKKIDLQEKFKTALHADVIISSGGVSVGDFDFVKDVMGEIGNACISGKWPCAGGNRWLSRHRRHSTVWFAGQSRIRYDFF